MYGHGITTLLKYNEVHIQNNLNTEISVRGYVANQQTD